MSVERVRALLKAGYTKQAIADELGWTRSRVRRLINKLRLDRNEAMEALYAKGGGSVPRQDQLRGPERTIETQVDRLIGTEEEALEAAEIDPAHWSVVSIQLRYYPIQSKHGVSQGTYIRLQLRKRTELANDVAVQALVDGALRARSHEPAQVVTVPDPAGDGVLCLVVINDVHFAKLCWAPSTGESNWNLEIARDTLLAAMRHIVSRLPACSRILVALLGDIFHYDTLAGTTSGGTQMDRDSRVALMLEIGTEAVVGAIRIAAAKAPVTVLLVPGNHDGVLTLALQRILVAEFRGTSVTVDDTYTRRKPFPWGKVLLQFDHGDKAKKKLRNKLSNEYPQLWGASTYREIHTGHLHTDAETVDAAFTDEGVIVRTHAALCPSDQWHYDEGYTGSFRAMQAFVYHEAGALEQVIRFDARVHMERAA